MGTQNSKHILPQTHGADRRFETLHFLLRDLVHGNFQAPVEEGLERGGFKVLDAGCGLGIWTSQMANDYPLSSFIGVDNTKIFPDQSGLPNCTFVQADMVKGLPFPDNTFDYVYQRFLSLMLSHKDWDADLAELVRVTKPGGWIELFEFDYNLQRPGPSGERLHKAIKDNCAARRAEATGSDRLERFTRKHQFEHTQSDFVMSPLGWKGLHGEMSSQAWRAMMIKMKAKLLDHMDVEGEEYDRLVEKAVIEFAEHKTWGKHPYLYAMKPLVAWDR